MGAYVLLVLSICIGMTGGHNANSQNISSQQFTWDPKGYLIFCLCMGRFGNQVDHFLGALAFAKSVDRTMVIPPWRTYKNVPFTAWFKVESLLEYHRVILAEDFMENLAPIHWPPDKRIGFCFNYNLNSVCEMKKGNPFQPFWDGLGVDFNSTQTYSTSYTEVEDWKSVFPADKYPVVALKGAPASYPLKVKDRPLQQYLQWSDDIKQEGDTYIDKTFKGQKFIGIHLRNGMDWKKACEFADGKDKFMESGQCLGEDGSEMITEAICYPPVDQILKEVKDIVMKTEASFVYVATDKSSLIQELTGYLKDLQVEVLHQDPWLPQTDLYVLGQSTHFIGNCISSFTAFVIRERTLGNKPSSFWGIP